MLNALTLLLLLQLLGEALVVSLGLPVPGPVLGMALMLALLGLRPALLDLLKPTTTGCCSTSRSCLCRPGWVSWCTCKGWVMKPWP